MMSLYYIVENFFVLKKYNPIHQPRNLVMLYKRVRVVLHEIAFLKFHFLLEFDKIWYGGSAIPIHPKSHLTLF